MRLAVTGLGMASTLGGCAQACAAMRAGLSRPGALSVATLDRDDPVMVPVTGHPMPEMDGFGALARCIRMGAAALADVIAASGLRADAPEWTRSALQVCTSAARPAGWEFFDELVAEELAPGIVAKGAPGLRATLLPPLFAGRAGVLLALRDAAETIRKGAADRVIVVGVDSLVTTEALEVLASQGLLKTSDQAVGMMPGEAAAAVMVEAESLARARQAVVTGYIEEVHATPTDALPPAKLGRGLAAVVEATWPKHVRLGELFADLNGESSRAEAWGHANVLLRPKRDLDGFRLVLPATSLGDTGAASAAIALCAALRAYVRRYARGEASVVLSMETPGHLAAARVTGVGPMNREQR